MQLPLPNTQANELPNSGSRAEALSSHFLMTSHRGTQGPCPTSSPARAEREKTPNWSVGRSDHCCLTSQKNWLQKKPLEKPVTVGSCSSCVLLMELKWIYILLLLQHGLPGAQMGSMYVLVWGTAKWNPSAGLKHGLLLKYISAERASITFLVVFFFLFIPMSWKMKTNFSYFSSLHCFDRLLSYKSWNSSVILYIDVCLPSLVRINNFSHSHGLKAS